MACLNSGSPSVVTHAERCEILALAAGAALVASAVGPEPVRVDDLLALPQSSRGVEVSEPRHVRGAPHDPARPAPDDVARDLVGRIEVGIGVGKRGDRSISGPSPTPPEYQSHRSAAMPMRSNSRS